MAEILKGKPVADHLDEISLANSEALREKGIIPLLLF